MLIWKIPVITIVYLIIITGIEMTKEEPRQATYHPIHWVEIK
jgi:hypothetical protein